MAWHLLFLALNLASTLASPSEPEITAAPHLLPRAGSDLVGYIGGAGDESRTCDFPQTLSTSDSFVRCCPTSGSCPFFTACSANTLQAAEGASPVPCDTDPTLTCNTAIVQATAESDQDGLSYIACWQTSLGSSAFTIAQTPGGGAAASESAPLSGTRAAARAGTITIPGSSTGSPVSSDAADAMTSASDDASATESGSGDAESASASASETGDSGAAPRMGDSGLSGVATALGALVLLLQRLI